MNPLGTYIRQRARQKGMSVSDLCKAAGKSRQTFYALSESLDRLPDMETLLDFAVALDVHPMRLLQLVFEEHRGMLCRRHERGSPKDASQFVRDVTIPDGTLVMAGTHFVKTWEVQNAGRTVWEDRFLRCMDEDLVVVSAHDGKEWAVSPQLVPEVRCIPIPRTPPGATVQLSVAFVAPAIPGTCVSYWKSIDASGELCFPDAVGLSAQIRVVAMEHTAMRRRSIREAATETGGATNILQIS